MDKKPLTKTERIILSRREIILDVATEMIRLEGFVNLNLNEVAKAVDCGVGAVYRSFHNKEEVLLAIALRGMEFFIGKLQEAHDYEGNSREKMVAVHLAHNSFCKTHPIEYTAFYTVKSDGVRERISGDSHAKLDDLTSRALNIAADIVIQAERNHDLRLAETVMAAELVYNFWALQFGNLMLSRFTYKNDSEFRERVVVQRLFFRQMLDGLGWKPLSDKFDYVASGKKIVAKLGLFV